MILASYSPLDFPSNPLLFAFSFISIIYPIKIKLHTSDEILTNTKNCIFMTLTAYNMNHIAFVGLR